MDLYKVEKVIIPLHAAFIQSNSDRKHFFMHDNMRTNRDIVVNTVLKKPEIIPWVSLRVL